MSRTEEQDTGFRIGASGSDTEGWTTRLETRTHMRAARESVSRPARSRVRPSSFTWEAQAAGEARGARSGESGKL